MVGVESSASDEEGGEIAQVDSDPIDKRGELSSFYGLSVWIRVRTSARFQSARV
jgi:hypothetical protein